MIRLQNDYNRGACKKILEKLAQINGESYDGYGKIQGVRRQQN